jgi:integrase
MIKKRGNSWWVVVYAGRDPLTGKKRQKTGTARTRTEARQLEARLLQEAGGGEHRAAGSRTVGELLEAWYRWRPTVRQISPRTLVTYRSYIDHKIDPALGNVRLSRVTTATIDEFMAQLRERGSKCQHCYHRVRTGREPLRAGVRYRPRPNISERFHETDCVQGIPLSPSAVRDVHAILSGAFKQAVVWEWSSKNPVTDATPPAVEKADVAPPKVAEAERLLDTAMDKDPELGLFLVLAVVLGARRSEVCRLRWTHINLDQGDVLVGGRIITLPGELRDAEWTKNRSKRRIALAAGVAELLRAHRVEQAKRALAVGVSLSPDAYVFSREPDGSVPRRPDSFTHRFTKLASRIGVDCRLHDLRHFMVTQLIAAGVDIRTVAGRAGHRDGGRTTLGVYAHFQAAQDHVAAELMEGLVKLPRGGTGPVV